MPNLCRNHVESMSNICRICHVFGSWSLCGSVNNYEPKYKTIHENWQRIGWLIFLFATHPTHAPAKQSESILRATCSECTRSHHRAAARPKWTPVRTHHHHVTAAHANGPPVQMHPPRPIIGLLQMICRVVFRYLQSNHHKFITACNKNAWHEGQ